MKVNVINGMNACGVLLKTALTPDAVHVLGDTLDSPPTAYLNVNHINAF
jgi:hypothetical protein